MSNITIFCFTTFCVDLPSIPSHEMAQSTLKLRYLERIIMLIDQKLEFFEDKLKLVHDFDVNDIVYSVSNDAMHAYAGPALKAVKDAVEAARTEGRNSSHCYTIAKRIIEDAARDTYDFYFPPCKANFTHTVQEIWQKVEPIREGIEHTQHYFDETVPSCYNSTDVAECLFTTVWTIEDAHELLETLVDSLMSEEKISYPKLKNDFKTCSTAIGTKIENASSFAQREGIRCAITTGTLIRQST